MTLEDHFSLYAVSQLAKERFLVELFCQRYDLQLINICADDEYSPPEGVLYFFSDQYGGYSIEGIRRSLE